MAKPIPTNEKSLSKAQQSCVSATALEQKAIPIKNQSQIDQKSMENHTIIDPKSIKYRITSNQKST